MDPDTQTQTGTNLKRYAVPPGVIDTLVWICHRELTSFEDVVRSATDDWQWSRSQLLCFRPWVSAPLLADWPATFSAAVVAVALQDPTASPAFQALYLANAFADAAVVPLLDGHLLGHDIEPPEEKTSRDPRAVACLDLFADWARQQRKKGRRQARRA